MVSDWNRFDESISAVIYVQTKWVQEITVIKKVILGFQV
jgi:hypothetical protein